MGFIISCLQCGNKYPEDLHFQFRCPYCLIKENNKIDEKLLWNLGQKNFHVLICEICKMFYIPLDYKQYKTYTCPSCKNILSSPKLSNPSSEILLYQYQGELHSDLSDTCDKNITTLKDMASPNLSDNARTRYRLLHKLGQGSQGRVWAMYDNHVQRNVALKQMFFPKKDYSSSEISDAKRVFIREVSLQAKLQHENILPIYDFEQEWEFPYYTMPQITGIKLSDFLRRWHGKNISDACWPECLRQIIAEKRIKPLLLIFQQICQCCDYLHRQGYVHRDIKSDNILLDAEGKPYLIDFGLTDLSNYVSDIAGTPGYIDPRLALLEKTLEKEDYEQADIFSLGMILLEIIGDCYVGEKDVFYPYTGIRQEQQEEIATITHTCPSFFSSKQSNVELKEYLKKVQNRPVFLPKYISIPSDVPDSHALLQICQSCLGIDSKGRRVQIEHEKKYSNSYLSPGQIAKDIENLLEYSSGHGFTMPWYKTVLRKMLMSPMITFFILFFSILLVLGIFIWKDIEIKQTSQRFVDQQEFEQALLSYNQLSWIGKITSDDFNQKLLAQKSIQKFQQKKYQENKETIQWLQHGPFTLHQCKSFWDTERGNIQKEVVKNVLLPYKKSATFSEQSRLEEEIKAVQNHFQILQTVENDFFLGYKNCQSKIEREDEFYQIQEVLEFFFSFLANGENAKKYLVFRLVELPEDYQKPDTHQIIKDNYRLLLLSLLYSLTYKDSSNFTKEISLPFHEEIFQHHEIKKLYDSATSWVLIGIMTFFCYPNLKDLENLSKDIPTKTSSHATLIHILNRAFLSHNSTFFSNGKKLLIQNWLNPFAFRVGRLSSSDLEMFWKKYPENENIYKSTMLKICICNLYQLSLQEKSFSCESAIFDEIGDSEVYIIKELFRLDKKDFVERYQQYYQKQEHQKSWKNSNSHYEIKEFTEKNLLKIMKNEIENNLKESMKSK